MLGTSRSGLRPRVAGLLLTLCLSLLPVASLGGQGLPSAAAAAGPVKVLIVGDSMTHGTPGDYTWRYFFWHGLTRNGGSFDFVGPYNDLYDENSPTRSSQAYADPNFDRDHASAWGNALIWPKFNIAEAVATYRPDVMVLFIGGNDLGFFSRTPAQVADDTASAIAGARVTVPGIKVVVVASVSSWVPNAAGFNAELANRVNAAVSPWNTPASPVVLASVPDYAQGAKGAPADTWDGAHPDTRGAVKIGAAVTDAAAALGLTTPVPRPLVFPAEGLRAAASLTATPANSGVTLNWVNPPGATTTRIWQRDVTAGQDWSVAVDSVPGAAWIGVGLINGHTYEFRTQSIKVWVSAEGLYSNVVTVVPNGPVAPSAPSGPVSPTSGPAPSAAPTPRPGTPGAFAAKPVPTGIAGDHGVRLDWPVVPAADTYLVWYREKAAGVGWATVPVGGATWTSPRLRAGAAYEFMVQAVNSLGVSDPSASLTLTPIGPIPIKPSGLKAKPKRGALSLQWQAVPAATSYVVRSRQGKGAWQTLETPTLLTTPATSAPKTWLKQGREIQVMARHDALDGPWSRVLRLRAR